MIDSNQLNKYLGDPISQICSNGYTDPNDNHCAHFVSHVLDYRFATTCRTMHNGDHPGANIRVHELFARCPQVGRWTDLPGHVKVCLVFVTGQGNVHLAHKSMDNVPKKHVGIHLGGKIWHYSNSRSQVVTQTPEEFSHHYPGVGFALFYGTLPLG